MRAPRSRDLERKGHLQLVLNYYHYSNNFSTACPVGVIRLLRIGICQALVLLKLWMSYNQYLVRQITMNFFTSLLSVYVCDEIEKYGQASMVLKKNWVGCNKTSHTEKTLNCIALSLTVWFLYLSSLRL